MQMAEKFLPELNPECPTADPQSKADIAVWLGGGVLASITMAPHPSPLIEPFADSSNVAQRPVEVGRSGRTAAAEM